MIERYTSPEMGRVWSTQTKLAKWLEVEIAVCEAWAELGVVPRDDIPKLRRARFDLEAIARYEAETHHDVTAFLRSVADSLGPEARWIHLGLTSSDVIDTGLALQLKDASRILDADLAALDATLTDLALRHRHTLMIGRTHGVHAEPTSFGLKCLLWLDELRRARARLAAATAEVAVGKISGPVGTHASVPPEVERIVCERLGLGIEPLSTQVVQRDRHAYYIVVLALIASTLDKIATELRSLQRTEILEVEEPFSEGQTGSSAMPHKRNPILGERISGLARVLRGYVVPALENVALWHERDISNSSVERVVFPDATTLLDYALRLLARVLGGLVVYPERMRRNLERTRGLVYSQRVLLALIERGLAREAAYKIVQRNAMRAWAEEADFQALLAADPDLAAHLAPAELAALFDPAWYLRHIDESYRRLGLGSAEATSAGGARREGAAR